MVVVVVVGGDGVDGSLSELSRSCEMDGGNEAWEMDGGEGSEVCEMDGGEGSEVCEMDGGEGREG